MFKMLKYREHTCADGYLDGADKGLPEHDVPALSVHVVKVLVNGEQVSHTELCSWLYCIGLYIQQQWAASGMDMLKAWTTNTHSVSTAETESRCRVCGHGREAPKGVCA